MPVVVVAPPGAVKPLLVSLAELSALLGKCPAVLRKDLACGRLPLPISGGGRQGAKQRWKLAEIERWVEAGCPDRATWEGCRRAKQRKR
jgi:hypothetical protein